MRATRNAALHSDSHRQAADAANAPLPGATGCRATLRPFFYPCEGGRAPRGASSWDPRDQNQGLHLRPVHAARIRLAECGSPIGAPPRRLKSGTVLPGPVREGGVGPCSARTLAETWGLRRYPEPCHGWQCHNAVSNRSTSSTSTTADPGNRRGRTMTRPPKDPGCPGSLGTAPAPSPNVFRKTPLWRERDKYRSNLFVFKCQQK